MIGVDTNVLVRLFIVDEPQSAVVARFFAKRSPSDPAYVSLVVIAELAWVLLRRYKYGMDRIGQAMQGMLDSDDFVVERRDVVEWALSSYTRSKIDFSDLLIARTGELGGALRTVTFDQNAAKLVPGMELLK